MRQCAPPFCMPCLYHTAVLWAAICPCFGGIANHYTHITPLMGERCLIPTLYTRVSVRLTTPTQKSVSIDTSGDGVNLTDCTDLCNRLKIALVLDALKIECISITTPCPVCLIALSQNRDARQLPAGSIRFWMHPPLRMSPLLGMPCFKAPSQIPPDVTALYRLRFSLRGMPVQMRGKQAFGVWE